MDFCTRAVRSEEQSSDILNGSVVQVGTYLACVTHSKMTELNGQAIRSAYLGFKGANLSITSFNRVHLLSLWMCTYACVTIGGVNKWTFIFLWIPRPLRERWWRVHHTHWKKWILLPSAAPFFTAALCTPKYGLWWRKYGNMHTWTLTCFFLPAQRMVVDQVCS